LPGMNTGLRTSNSTIVEAFQSLLKHEGLAVLVLLALLALGWNAIQAVRIRREAKGLSWPSSVPVAPEAVARRLLRISFGIIWIFDGILQAQASMPLGMTTQVIQPSAAASPTWVQHLVNVGGTIWSNHPITAPASAVWIQVGIGFWLLAAPRGNWSRAAGAASVVWGLVVWVFGESFGGIFAPGLTWAFGAPGAVLFYCVAGVLIALPERSWRTPRLGTWILRAMGAFFLGMAVLQAWPGRGFWQGHLGRHSTPGTLTAMVLSMAQTPQPRLFSTWVASFASFDEAHGWAVNLFFVIFLAALGVAFLSGRPRLVLGAVVVGIVVCLADWILIEDFGFLGGVGTDPNSMIPMALLFSSGYLAITKVPATASAPVPITSATNRTLRDRLVANPTYAFRVIAGVCAIGVVLVGAAPMAVASINPHADPIVSQAIDGTPDVVNYPAPAFALVNQHGARVTLGSFRGKAVALAFLDPVCVSDCPIIAQELRAADAMLGSEAGQVQLVAVVINPVYRSQAYLAAFDQQEGLNHLSNWDFLTGSASSLQSVWNHFGVIVGYSTGGAMIAHSDMAYVIDRTGHVRDLLNTDPGPGSEAMQSSTSVVLANALQSALQSP
jgi:cytochrome oxidase Cu insertion factor (SCO1/SenC/PrrC family)